MGDILIPTFAAGQSHLDLGRHPATEQDVEAMFVTDTAFAASTTRASIWQEWQAATSFLRSHVPVISAWVAGSFTTTKLDPNDIDCLYLIDHDEVQKKNSDVQANQALSLFATPGSLQAIGYRVDSYVCVWRAVTNPSAGLAVDGQYYRDRGHWDDWWQRQRVTGNGAPPTRDDAIPRRGYVEVMLDGIV